MRPMIYTRNFKEVDKEDVTLAGGKGASLGEMTRVGIPVPPGFVVTAQAFEKFLEVTDLNVELDAILDRVNHEVIHEVDDASEKIKALILGKEMPQEMADAITAAFKKLDAKFVAVRSSATSEDSAAAAWAGQLDTYLNTTERDLLENVKKCWASLFTPRAIFYRFEKGLHGTPISVAVVVQKMIQSEVSGIAFSVHPVTQDYDQMIIEAGFGLGEAIVSGSITPDSYVIEKSNRKILDVNISVQSKGLFRNKAGGNEWRDLPESEGEKQSLADEEVLELSDLVIKIEKHYGFPVDVEWAREKNSFYVVQSRPITTLSKQLEQVQKKEYIFLWGQKQSAMLVDVMIAALGQEQEVMNEGISEDLALHIDGVCENYMPLKAIDEWRANGHKYFDKKFTKKLFSDIDALTEKFYVFGKKIGKLDVTNLSNQELKDLLTEHKYFIYKGLVFFATSSPGSTYLVEQKIKEIISAKVSDEELQRQYFIDLSTPAEMDVTMRERLDWLDLIKQRKVTDGDLRQYAFNYPGLFLNTYNQEEVLKFLRARLHEKKSTSEIKAEKERMKNNLREVKKKHQETLSQFEDTELEYLTSILQRAGLGRFRLKHVWSGSEYVTLNLLHKIRKRMNIPLEDLIKTYTFADIYNFLDNQILLPVEEVENRKTCTIFHYLDGTLSRYSGSHALEMKQKMIGTRTSDNAAIKELHGDIANRGMAQGKARVVLVRDLKQFIKDSEAFQRGEILVTTMTSPVMVPIIEKAAAIITDEGGICSHAAISAREFGIPCLVGTQQGSSVIKTGDEIEIDANIGVVRIL